MTTFTEEQNATKQSGQTRWLGIFMQGNTAYPLAMDAAGLTFTLKRGVLGTFLTNEPLWNAGWQAANAGNYPSRFNVPGQAGMSCQW